MDNKEGNSYSECKGIMWWSMLVVAVLAVPAIGGVVALMLPFKGITQLGIFVFACWISTFLGMKLMTSGKK